MPETEFRTLTAAFGYFGAFASNIRSAAWSAKSPDGNTVVLTWWKDEKRRDGDGKLIMDSRDHPRLNQWCEKKGNRDRIKKLKHARDYCDGLFRIVWITAADPNARVRKTIKRRPDKTLWMRLDPDSLNEQTGEFLAKEAKHA